MPPLKHTMLPGLKPARLRPFFAGVVMAALLPMLLAATASSARAETVVKVADFGAVVDDGHCDVAAIRAAVASVADQSNVRIVFDAGVYNLAEDSVVDREGWLAMVHLWGLDDWVIEGAVDAAGDPATTLEMNLALRNEVTGAQHLEIRDCNRFEVRNLILDQNPRQATAATVTAVNRSTGLVRIEVFEGMPHFDGMASFSANNWDLSTGLLIPGPPVTIGINPSAFGNWSAVAGSPGTYTMQSTQIANRVSVGEGLSFHFNIVIPDGRTINAYQNTDLVFENIFVYNAIGMVMGAFDNRNMTFRRFHIKPEGNSLAVGPRDGLHMSRNSGRLLMDDVLVRGVRWDPLVIFKRYAPPVDARLSDTSIRLDPLATGTPLVLGVLGVGSVVHFWSGADPSVRTVSGVSDGVIEFTEPLDPSVTAGVYITPGEWHLQEAVIRNSKIESNYGTALVYQSDNLLVENCIFRNNAYSNIGLGPTSLTAGMFTRNIVIRNNLFETSTWEPKYSGYLKEHRGTITLFNKSDKFSSDQAYHRNIVIEDNLFRDLTGSNAPAAIDVKLAEGVIVRNNRYENVASDSYVDAATTAGVSREGLGFGRNLNSAFKLEALPSYLDGFQMIRFERGENVEVPAFEFTVDRPVTVYLAVHDRGTPTIPANWTVQPEQVTSRTTTSVLTDSLYRADFEAGQVQIPGHDGTSGSWYAVPHMLFVAPQDGDELPLSPASFTFPSTPGIQHLDLELYWSGDSKTPFEWAMESGFVEGPELSMFLAYLLNRRDMDQPFAVKSFELHPATQSVRLAWPSDGLPHGQVTMRASPDLTLPTSEWSTWPGVLSHDGQQTIFEANFSPDGPRHFFRAQVSE